MLYNIYIYLYVDYGIVYFKKKIRQEIKKISLSQSNSGFTESKSAFKLEIRKYIFFSLADPKACLSAQNLNKLFKRLDFPWITLFFFLSFYLSLSLSLSIFIDIYFSMFISLSHSFCFYLYRYLFLSVYLSFSLPPIFISICLSFYLSLLLSLYMSFFLSSFLSFFLSYLCYFSYMPYFFLNLTLSIFLFTLKFFMHILSPVLSFLFIFVLQGGITNNLNLGLVLKPSF